MAVVIVDDFLQEFDAFNRWTRKQKFEGVRNPKDGVVYPDLVANIPSLIRAKVQQGLEAALESKVQINQLFLRNTSKDTSTAPHQAHTDTIQGSHIMLLYMQDGPEGAGTSLVRHKEIGLDKDPITQEEFEVWDRDKNIADKWEIYHLIQMKANRAAMGIWSALMHRAEPIQGFGESPVDGRIVLICFFDKVPG
jgi:hypothetical protein